MADPNQVSVYGRYPVFMLRYCARQKARKVAATQLNLVPIRDTRSDISLAFLASASEKICVAETKLVKLITRPRSFVWLFVRQAAHDRDASLSPLTRLAT